MPKPTGKPIREAIPPQIADWVEERLKAIHADMAAGNHADAHVKITAMAADMRSCHYYDDGTIVCG